MKVSLRQTADVAQVKAMHQLCFPGDAWDSGPQRNRQMWIAEDLTGTPVGFCTARWLPKESSVFLERAGVLPIAKGIGLQRRMIRVRVAWARKRGAEAVITYTTYPNHASIVNLLRCGFWFYCPEYYWAGKDVHYFTFPLRPTSKPQ